MLIKNFYKSILSFIVIIVFACFSLLLTGCQKKKIVQAPAQDPYFSEYLPMIGLEAEEYVKSKDLNRDYCILVDFSIPSGNPRLFLWSFAEKRVIFKAHTMHGPGGGSTEQNAVLGNVSGSNCSAPGHFRITRDQGAMVRPSFRLQGLDGTNGNAYDRGIMLHGAWLVDQCLERQMEYFPIDKMWCAGCITTSTQEMDYLESFIRSQTKLLLLWSFQSKSGQGGHAPQNN